MSPSEFDTKFPELEPIQEAPSLGSVNGFGFIPRGHRDYDEQTNTYVITVYLCALYLPLFPVGSYRIQKHEDTYAILGRQPVASSAYALCFVIIAAILALASAGGWYAYTQTDSYKSGQLFTQAQTHITQNQPGDASLCYEQLIRSYPDHKKEATQKLATLIGSGLDQASGPQTAQAIDTAVTLNRGQAKLELVPDLVATAIHHADRLDQNEPQFALQLLDLVQGLEPNSPRLAKSLQPILANLLQKNPDDLQARDRLAQAFESLGDVDACRELLAPYATQLQTTEASRILGQIYIDDGNLDVAYILLNPYVTQKLNDLHAAEQAYDQTVDQIWDQSVASLENGEVSDDWYARYEAADENAQAQMVQQYVVDRISADTAVDQKRIAMMDAASVVPVALELGMVKIHRARNLQDQAQRQTEFESAEKTLLAIASFSEENAQYQMFLAQVYWWMGREEEANQRFDMILQGKESDYQTLIAVAGVLREVGATQRAREMYLQAYEAATDSEAKQTVAYRLSVMALNSDDELKWLKLSDLKNSMTRASMHGTQARQFANAGDEQKAIQEYRKAAAVYAQMLDNTATLNNAALIYSSLYDLTAEPEDSRRAADLIRRALELDPRDSIMLRNATSLMLQAVAADLIETDIDLKTLRGGASLSLLSTYYNNSQQREAYRKQIREHPLTGKILSYEERLRLVAPSSPSSYAIAISIASYTRDETLLRELSKEVQRANIDREESQLQSEKWQLGQQDQTVRQGQKARIKKTQDIIENLPPQTTNQTRAIALSSASYACLAPYRLGDPIDVATAVDFAEQAYAIHPSSYTSNALYEARLTRGLMRQASDPQLASLIKQTRRSVDEVALITWIFFRDLPPAENLANDPDIRAAATMIAQQINNFPDSIQAWEWFFMKRMDPEFAKSVEQKVRDNHFAPILNQVASELNTRTIDSVMNDCLYAELAGRSSEISDILAQAKSQGIVVP